MEVRVFVRPSDRLSDRGKLSLRREHVAPRSNVDEFASEAGDVRASTTGQGGTGGEQGETKSDLHGGFQFP
jgi:hypothetical protein